MEHHSPDEEYLEESSSPIDDDVGIEEGLIEKREKL